MKRTLLALLLISTQAYAGQFNGSGQFVRSYSWSQDAASGLKISSSRMDTEDNGFASGLSMCITKDGQQNPTAPLPMNGFNHTGVGNATARNQYAALGQVQDGGATWGGTATGTANAITVTLSPVLLLLSAGQRFKFVASAANTSAVTLAVSGLTATAVTKGGTTPLVANDILAGAVVEVEYDGTQFQLINPTLPSAASNAQALAGTDTTHFVTSAGLASSNTSSVFKMPGGNMIEWGQTPNLNHNSNTTITLPVAYTSAIYSLYATPIVATGSENGQSCSVNVVSVSQITVSNTGASAGVNYTCTWMTIGN